MYLYTKNLKFWITINFKKYLSEKERYTKVIILDH